MELFKMCYQNKQRVLSSIFHNWWMLCAKNMCSKQVRGYFLVYSSLISIVRLMFVILQKKFSEAGGCFLVYSATFLNRKHVCSKQVAGCFLVYYLLISIITLKCFFYEFYKNFHECCFLVYWANCIKLLQTAAFNSSSN